MPRIKINLLARFDDLTAKVNGLVVAQKANDERLVRLEAEVEADRTEAAIALSDIITRLYSRS